MSTGWYSIHAIWNPTVLLNILVIKKDIFTNTERHADNTTCTM